MSVRWKLKKKKYPSLSVSIQALIILCCICRKILFSKFSASSQGISFHAQLQQQQQWWQQFYKSFCLAVSAAYSKTRRRFHWSLGFWLLSVLRNSLLQWLSVSLSASSLSLAEFKWRPVCIPQNFRLCCKCCWRFFCFFALHCFEMVFLFKISAFIIFPNPFVFFSFNYKSTVFSRMLRGVNHGKIILLESMLPRKQQFEGKQFGFGECVSE